MPRKRAFNSQKETLMKTYKIYSCLRYYFRTRFKQRNLLIASLMSLSARSNRMTARSWSWKQPVSQCKFTARQWTSRKSSWMKKWAISASRTTTWNRSSRLFSTNSRSTWLCKSPSRSMTKRSRSNNKRTFSKTCKTTSRNLNMSQRAFKMNSRIKKAYLNYSKRRIRNWNRN